MQRSESPCPKPIRERILEEATGEKITIKPLHVENAAAVVLDDIGIARIEAVAHSGEAFGDYEVGRRRLALERSFGSFKASDIVCPFLGSARFSRR